MLWLEYDFLCCLDKKCQIVCFCKGRIVLLSVCAFQIVLSLQWTFQINDSNSFKSFLEDSECHVPYTIVSILFSGIILKFHFHVIKFYEGLP